MMMRRPPLSVFRTGRVCYPQVLPPLRPPRVNDGGDAFVPASWAEGGEATAEALGCFHVAEKLRWDISETHDGVDGVECHRSRRAAPWAVRGVGCRLYQGIFTTPVW
eukprot:scaffold114_cov200-Alexandrium_tamarense.AAC.43